MREKITSKNFQRRACIASLAHKCKKILTARTTEFPKIYERKACIFSEMQLFFLTTRIIK